MVLHVFVCLLDEVGGRRVALGYVFNRPFPNPPGTFRCNGLSRPGT